jgi:hypothetical protein
MARAIKKYWSNGSTINKKRDKYSGYNIKETKERGDYHKREIP